MIYSLFFNSLFNKRYPNINAKISAIIALHNIVTTLWLKVAIIIIAGTKKITSLANANKVDLTLDPIDCNIIDNDLVIQVNIIPPKKIRKQYLAYSIYSNELPLPKILIIKVGKISNNPKAIHPIIKLVIKIYFIVSLTLFILATHW